MRSFLLMLALFATGSALACDIAVKSRDGLSATIDKSRHGLKNELTLFVTLENQGKAPLKLADAKLLVEDEHGERVAPVKVEVPAAELAPGAKVQLVSHYLPSASYTAVKLNVE
ncbi:hypothetical protein [Chitinolyticbacter meiyuanensis]|uniref:hypothetical protein n=1 Tax=Chitinolyticbacter meiyuanensis TaxID=682798 RepID=UPI0011E5EA4E|nr:hypothetical protein [Chitinolyticbacter meiyuanensis]